MPGGLPALDPLLREAQHQALTQQGHAIENQAADLEQRLAYHLASGLEATGKPAQDMANRLNGYLTSNIEASDRKAGAIAGKLGKRLNDMQGNAYQGLFSYGGRYPTDEEVIYGLQTGDVLGSVGLSLPGPTGRATASGNDFPPVSGPGEPLPVVGSLLPVADPGTVPIGTVGSGVGVVGAPAAGGGGVAPVPLNAPGGWGPGFGPGWGQGFQPPPTVPPPTAPPPAPVPEPFNPPADNSCWWVPPAQRDPRYPCGGLPPVPMGWYGPDPAWRTDRNGNPIPDANCCCPPGYIFSTGSPLTGPSVCIPNTSVPPPSPPPIGPPPDGGPPPPPPGDCPPCAPPPPSPPPETCAPPASAPVCPPTPAPFPAGGDWGDDFCAKIVEWIAALDSSEVKPGDWVGMQRGSAESSNVGRWIAEAVMGKPDAIVPSIIARAKDWAEKTNRAAVESLGCNSGTSRAIWLMQAVARFIQRWLDILPPQFLTALEQASNTVCQSKIPTQPGADQAYLNNTITEETWRCWTQANGNFQKAAGDVMWAGRTKPNAREVDLLYRRGLLNQAAYDQKMRAAGIMSGDDQGDIANLNLQYPDKADLIRYMVRDVFDEEVVAQSGLSTDFERKFVGDALKYADALGLPKQHMLYAWRAHWQLPSLTMAGQMLARCREGRVPDNAVVREEDVIQLLKQDDWAPGWIPSMMEIIKQPLTRVDTRRMFQLHNATPADLKEYYLDLRYADADADQLVKFAQVQRDVAEAKASGLPTQRTAIMQYARGELTKIELHDTLTAISITPALAAQAEQSAELARTVYRRKSMVAGLRKQFIAGLIDEGDATALLAKQEVDAEAIEELLDIWRLDLKDRGKHASAAQLCKWRSMNLVGPAEQQAALERVGWSSGDASRIVSQCEIELSDKQRRAAERAQKEELKAMEKAQAKAKAKAKEDGTWLPPRKRTVTVRKSAGKVTTTDAETIPVPALPGDPADVADGL